MVSEGVVANEVLEKSESAASNLKRVPFTIAAVVAFAYAFGTLYLNRYYGFFSIPEGALSFGVQDYVANSVVPAVLAIAIGVWVELIYQNIRSNHYLGFNMTRIGEIRKASTKSLSLLGTLKAAYKDDPHHTMMNIAMLVSLVTGGAIGLGYAYLAYTGKIQTEAIWLTLWLAFSIGAFAFIAIETTKLAYSEVYRDFGISHLVSVVVVLAAFYVMSVGIIGEAQARYDMSRFPTVVVESRTRLPVEISQAPDERYVSKTLRVVIINNNRLYGFPDEEMGSPTPKDRPVIYALDYSAIEYFKCTNTATNFGQE